jgi:DME family drug/metabolite transporter
VVRLAIGGAILVALAAAQRSFGDLRRWPRFPTALGAVGVAAYQLCFFSGVARTGVALGTIVAIGSAPAFTGLLGLIARGERPERGWAPATALAVGGAALLLAPGAEAGADPGGILLALGAGAAYATFAVASKELMDAGCLPAAVMAVAFGGGACLLLPLLLTSDLTWLADPRGAAVALHLGVVATALAYVLFSRGLQRTPVTTAATLSLAEPLTAATLGLVVLGERLTTGGLAGTILLCAGLLVLARPQPTKLR